MGDLGYEELKENLLVLPTVAVKAVAARTALQELPYAFELSGHSWNRIGGQQFLLACFRASIVSGLAATRPNPEILALNADVVTNLNAASVRGLVGNGPKEADSTFYAALSSTFDVSDMIQELCNHLTTYHWDGLQERSTDASALTVAPENIEQVFASKLWYGEAPEHYASLSQQFFDNALGTPWEFWAEWYEGMLNGIPLEWELQRRVALIDDGVWRVGPEAVAEEIGRIRARWEVERTLTRLKESLSVQTPARHGIGGNNPPESIQDERLSSAVTLIWEAAEELSTAMEQESPAREWIAAILQKLKVGCLAFAKWIGRKADLAVDTAIVTAIKQGGPLVGGYYALDKLIKAIEEWLPFLP